MAPKHRLDRRPKIGIFPVTGLDIEADLRLASFVIEANLLVLELISTALKPIFVHLLKLLEMIVAVLDECIGQEEEIYCWKLVKLKKFKPGSEIKNKTNVANVSKGCFIIPSMQFLQDNKKFYSSG